MYQQWFVPFSDFDIQIIWWYFTYTAHLNFWTIILVHWYWLVLTYNRGDKFTKFKVMNIIISCGSYYNNMLN